MCGPLGNGYPKLVPFRNQTEGNPKLKHINQIDIKKPLCFTNKTLFLMNNNCKSVIGEAELTLSVW